jgi:hypothetical protein
MTMVLDFELTFNFATLQLDKTKNPHVLQIKG